MFGGGRGVGGRGGRGGDGGMKQNALLCAASLCAMYLALDSAMWARNISLALLFAGSNTDSCSPVSRLWRCKGMRLWKLEGETSGSGMFSLRPRWFFRSANVSFFSQKQKINLRPTLKFPQIPNYVQLLILCEKYLNLKWKLFLTN